MTTRGQQLELPGMTLADVGTLTRLTVSQCAKRLGCTDQHIVNLIEEGTLGALDIARKTSSANRSKRARYVVPAEAWMAFLGTALLTPWRSNPIRDLPTQSLIRLHAEICAHLRSKGVPAQTLARHIRQA